MNKIDIIKEWPNIDLSNRSTIIEKKKVELSEVKASLSKYKAVKNTGSVRVAERIKYLEDEVTIVSRDLHFMLRN